MELEDNEVIVTVGVILSVNVVCAWETEPTAVRVKERISGIGNDWKLKNCRSPF